jgi:RNA polymerase sigma factor (sigma-70 family)
MDEAMTGSQHAESVSRQDRLAELYLRHAPNVHRLAYLLLGDQEAASDVVQDAFVRLFGHFRNLRNASSFEWYLRRTVLNLCRDARRTRIRDSFREQRLIALEFQSQQESQFELPSSIQEQLLALPYRQRAAIVLRYLEDLSIEQTADLMGTSVSSVKNLVSRGMAVLRDSREKTGGNT